MQLIIWGNLIGFVFALVVLAMTVITFPLLLDRDVGAVAAVTASIRATILNPVPVLLWGLIVAALLVIGTIPVFAGLALVIPILGHDEDEVDIVEHVLDGAERGCRIERHADLLAEIADGLQRAMQMRPGFGVDGDAVAAGLGKGLEIVVDRRDHQVAVEGRRGIGA